MGMGKVEKSGIKNTYREKALDTIPYWSDRKLKLSNNSGRFGVTNAISSTLPPIFVFLCMQCGR